MGACFSSRTTSASTFNNIRVVHLNGFVEEFENPVNVAQVADKSPKHFLCTQVQLLSTCPKPLKPDTQLEPGNIYFLLPFSALQADVSPMDLASIVRKLTAMAKTSHCKSKSPRISPLLSQNDSNPATTTSSPNRFMESETSVVAYGGGQRSWRPALDTIREQREVLEVGQS